MSGFFAGLATGLLTGAGVGGGTLLVLWLTAFGGMEQGMAQGINLLYFLICAPAALISHFKNGLVALKPGLIAAGAGMAAALLTASLSLEADPKLLGRLFGGLLIAVGLRELFSRGQKEKAPPPGGEEPK